MELMGSKKRRRRKLANSVKNILALTSSALYNTLNEFLWVICIGRWRGNNWQASLRGLIFKFQVISNRLSNKINQHV
jgi:hypothetical protein